MNKFTGKYIGSYKTFIQITHMIWTEKNVNTLHHLN